MSKKASRTGEVKTSAAKIKRDLIERQQSRGLSKGAMAAERASAGIGTDDRDPDNFFRPTTRS
jgi:hypothetical protein